MHIIFFLFFFLLPCIGVYVTFDTQLCTVLNVQQPWTKNRNKSLPPRVNRPTMTLKESHACRQPRRKTPRIRTYVIFLHACQYGNRRGTNNENSAHCSWETRDDTCAPHGRWSSCRTRISRARRSIRPPPSSSDIFASDLIRIWRDSSQSSKITKNRSYINYFLSTEDHKLFIFLKLFHDPPVLERVDVLSTLPHYLGHGNK